jgi:hypothetical protein
MVYQQEKMDFQKRENLDQYLQPNLEGRDESSTGAKILDKTLSI